MIQSASVGHLLISIDVQNIRDGNNIFTNLFIKLFNLRVYELLSDNAARTPAETGKCTR